MFAVASRVLAAEPPREPYWVDFAAGRVELDQDLSRLRLERHVEIRVDRYRLTSEKLVLERTPRGVVVDGEGRVAFCRCPDPPVSFGFRRAIVAPPTDLFVKNPTVYVGDVPVFWLPVLWLRAPDRLGLLPPRIAWRGEDGLLAGSGVHVPLGGRRGPSLETLDVLASGYLKGGVELESQLATEHTSTRVRFDRLHESLLAIDAHGSSVGRSGAAAAWQVDAIRGARARKATLELEPAARPYDRARGYVGESSGPWSLGFGVGTTLERGGALRTSGAYGPSAFAGVSSALGAGSALGADLAAETLRDPLGASTSHVLEGAELRGDTTLGPVLVSGSVTERAAMRSAELGSSSLGFGGARARVALPFARAFGEGSDPLLHRVEPFVEGGVRGGFERLDARAPLAELAPLANERVLLAAAGVESALGRRGARSALAVGARGGYVGPFDAPERLLAGTLAGDAEYAAVRADAAWSPGRERALATRGRLRLGRRDSLHTIFHAEGRLESEPTLARALYASTWDQPGMGWLDRSGFALGGAVGVPFTRWLASSFGADADASAERLLAVRGALGYRHPCGCLAVLSSAGHRVGRGGIDAQVTLDLMP